MTVPFSAALASRTCRASLRSRLAAPLFLLLLLFGSCLCAQTTTVSGTVYMPNGTNVLPHALVYLTQSTPAALVSGANCPGVNCLTAANAIPSGVTIHTYTAVDGTFTLTNVSESTTYTLVIQAGHWRRQFIQVIGTSPTTGLSLSMPSTHLQGDIPLIAIATGQADAAECVLLDLGLNQNEITDDSVTSGATHGGRIHLYRGDTSPGAELSASTPGESALMGNTAKLNTYDMVMFPCQGGSSATAESNTNIDHFLAYTSAGGRAFITHDSRGWINTPETYMGASFSGVATWLSTWLLAVPPDPNEATVNTSFTAGQSLAKWLYNGGYSYNNVEGQVELSTLRSDLQTVNAPAQTWLTLNDSTHNYPVMQISFNAPFGAPATSQYGRVMFNEYHVENVSESTNPVPIFPAECPTLTSGQIAQEKILEYALFDLSNFVTPVVLPTVSIAITTTPSNHVFNEGDTTDTINVNVTNTSSTVPLDTSTVLTVQLPAGLTATAITDAAGGWICNVATLICTRTATLAASASDAIVVTVSVAGNATGSSASTTPSVSATVASSTFSSSVNTPLTITLQRHAAVTWATPASISAGYALSGTQLNAVGNTAGTYVYTPAAGNVLTVGPHPLSVTFTPSNQATYPGTATTTVTLLVTAAGQATATAPTATNFGPIPVGTASSPQTVTFTLVAPGVIGTPLVVTQGAAGLDFADANTGTCHGNGTSYVYTANSTCTVNVIFTPGQPGPRYGAVLLEDQSGNVIATAYVYGVGLGPQVAFDAGKIQTLPIVFGGTHTISGIATDSNGNLYIADATRCIVQQYATGTTTTTLLAGTSGTCMESGDGGAAASAKFKAPSHVAISGRGDLYISDTGNFVVRKVDAITGYVSVVAGTVGTSGYSGDSAAATSATLSSPRGLVLDGAGNLYIADSTKLVRRVDAVTGIITTVAGKPSVAAGYSGNGAAATNAQMNRPVGLAIDGSNNLYIADAANNVIRKVTASTGFISTVAGTQYTGACMYAGDGAAATSAHLCDPEGISLDAAGNLYIADTQNNVLRKVDISNGYILTLAGAYNSGTGSYTGDGGSEKLAGLNHELDIALDGSGKMYLADATNGVIRVVSPAAAVAVFGTYPAGTSSPALDVTVTNNGNTTLDLTALTTTANFNLSGADTSCTATGTLATAVSCILGIEFFPTTTGALTATTTLTDNFNNIASSTQAVALSGSGGVSLTVLPSTTTLTAGTVGTVYASQTFTASGGTPAYTYAFTGIVPAGLTLSSGGVLSGTPTSAGSFSFTVIATDSLSATGSRTYTLTVAAGTATVTLGSLAQTYTGSPLAADATTVPSGLTVDFVYTGTGGTIYGPSSIPPTAAGSYTVVGTIDDPDYTGSQTGTLVIAKAAAAVTLSNLAQTYTGSALAVTSGTAPSGLTVGLTYSSATYGPSSTPPMAAGSYTVAGTISDANYAGTDTEILVIAKATAPVTLSNLAQTYTGSPLPVTETTVPASLSVGLVYSSATYGPSSTPPTAPGSYTVAGTISDANYTGSDTETLVIAKATAPVTLSNLAQTYTGSPLAATATTTPAGLTVGLVYTGSGESPYGPSSTPPTAAGSYTVTGTVADPNYTGTQMGTLVIAPAAIPLTLSNLAQTYTGAPLAATATTVPANLATGLVYTGTNGTPYGPSATPPTLPGSYAVAASVNNANYTGTATATLVIAKAAAAITLGNLTQAYTGAPLAASATTAPANVAVALVYTGANGTTYGPSATPPTAPGTYTVTATVNDPDYTGSAIGTLVIGKSPATVTLGNLAQTYTGSPLPVSAATVPASLAVIVTYNGSSTVPTAAGSYSVVATINDPLYAGTSTRTLVISQVASTVVVASDANPALSMNAFNLIATVSTTVGSPTGTVNFLNGTTLLGSAPVAAGVATFAALLPAGSYPVTAVYAGDTNHAPATSLSLAQSVLDFSLTPTPGGNTTAPTTSIPTATAAPGAAATYQLSIVPTAGVSFPTPVMLSVSGAPAGSTLNIAPATWNQLSATSWSFPAHTPLNALSMTVQLPAASALSRPPGRFGAELPTLLWALLLLPFSGKARRSARSLSRATSLLVLLAASLGTAVLLSGCGATSGLYAPHSQQKTYIVTVTATSGTLIHSTQVSLTVQQ